MDAPEDPARRAARRAAYKAHHPDVGGDPLALQRALDDIDRRFARKATPTSYDAIELAPRSAAGERINRALSGARRRTRRAGRTVRARIPASWPGSRRYFDL